MHNFQAGEFFRHFRYSIPNGIQFFRICLLNDWKRVKRCTKRYNFRPPASFPNLLRRFKNYNLFDDFAHLQKNGVDVSSDISRSI